MSKFYWPNVFKDVKEYVTSCPPCQKVGKRTKSPRAPQVVTGTPTKPFEEIFIDIAGPLINSKRGYQYILVIIDAHSHFPEFCPLRKIDARSIAVELIKFFSRVGIPTRIRSDNASNFKSDLMHHLYQLMGVTQ